MRVRLMVGLLAAALSVAAAGCGSAVVKSATTSSAVAVQSGIAIVEVRTRQEVAGLGFLDPPGSAVANIDIGEIVERDREGVLSTYGVNHITQAQFGLFTDEQLRVGNGDGSLVVHRRPAWVLSLPNAECGPPSGPPTLAGQSSAPRHGGVSCDVTAVYDAETGQGLGVFERGVGESHAGGDSPAPASSAAPLLALNACIAAIGSATAFTGVFQATASSVVAWEEAQRIPPGGVEPIAPSVFRSSDPQEMLTICYHDGKFSTPVPPGVPPHTRARLIVDGKGRTSSAAGYSAATAATMNVKQMPIEGPPGAIRIRIP